MPAQVQGEEPPSTTARPLQGRASIVTLQVQPEDSVARAALRAWLDAVPLLEQRDLTATTRTRLEDGRRIAEELANVLEGREPGEGRARERTLHIALARDRVQGLCSMFACPGGTFIELLVTAPWNALGPDDPPDPRTFRGAGTALIGTASHWSARRGTGGRVALQAENARAGAFYERLGFRPLLPGDEPLAMVPPGEQGWSPAILRLAMGRPTAEEVRSPWLVLDPLRLRAGAALPPRPLAWRPDRSVARARPGA
ncbi:MAG TPA: GNAT family N-acetyltransferase [Anaeromyxobacteraceae bacterium]|nr:GNAT family N-acetyltransferase [Anaeromyxobacteraceae bacterium]